LLRPSDARSATALDRVGVGIVLKQDATRFAFTDDRAKLHEFFSGQRLDPQSQSGTGKNVSPVRSSFQAKLS
jgi:hypothetical protein